MKTIPHLFCLLLLLSASGIVSALDRAALRHPHSLNGSAVRSPAMSAAKPSRATVWPVATPPPPGRSAADERAGRAVSFGF